VSERALRLAHDSFKLYHERVKCNELPMTMARNKLVKLP